MDSCREELNIRNRAEKKAKGKARDALMKDLHR
jgi:hypothetical protein